MKLEHCSRESCVQIIESLTKSLNAALDENQKLRDKQWVGLTEEDIEEAINANCGTGLWSMAKDIEDKLWEKNNG